MKAYNGTSDKTMTLGKNSKYLLIPTNAVHNSLLSADLFNVCNKLSASLSMLVLRNELYQSFKHTLT